MKKKMIAAMLAAMCLCSAATANVYAEETVKDLAVFEEGEMMTLKDVIELSKKGSALTWGDFVKYKGVDVGSGLYILEYVLGNGYILHVGGVPPTAAIAEAKIEYIRLSHGKKSIDIRTDDVEAFITEINGENDPTALKGTKTMTVADVRELAKKGNDLDWKDFEDYKGRDIGSGIYIWEFELEDGLKLDVSGLVDRKPDRIWLYRSDIKDGIDIRKDDINGFLHMTTYAVMTVTVTDVSGNNMLVTPSDGSSGLFTLPQKYLDDDIKPVVGMKLEVTFSGGILETYPAQFGGVKKVTVVSGEAKQIKGDANCDGGVDMADVVLIMQSLANPDKYQLTETGRINADMDGNGVTVADAQAIQMKLLGLDKEEIENIDSSLIANKQFVYDTENELGAYVISFSDNGSYFSIQGDFDAPRDTGTWKISGNTVVLTGQFGTNRFSVTETVLTYIAEGSDGFDNVKPKDGEKFYVAYENSGKNELKASDIVSIKTPYNPAMSNWSGIGILLEVDSPNCSILLRAADGHFVEWDIKTGSGPIKSVGKEYDAGKNGYIFWTPDEMHYKDGFNTEIQVIGVSGDVYIDFGKIYVSQVDGMKFVASFDAPNSSESIDSSVVAGKTFVYEKEGFGGDCTIEFKEDGTFLYSPGYLSSYLGRGTWEISGNKVILTQENDGMVAKRVNCFRIVGNELIYIEADSDNFIGTKVKDGEKFYVKQSAATLLGINKAKVTGVKVSSLPQGYDYSFTGDKAQAVVDYLSGLSLSSELSVQDPGQLNGMLWVIRLDYENGDTITLYDSGKFIHGEEHKWYEMPYEESQGLSELIWKLGK